MDKPFARQGGVWLRVQEAILLGSMTITSEQNEPKRTCDFGRTVDSLPFIHFLISYEVPPRLTPANMMKKMVQQMVSKS